MIGCIISFIAGGFVGALVMALCTASKNSNINIDLEDTNGNIVANGDVNTANEPVEINTGWIPVSNQIPGDERLKCWVTIWNVDRKIPFVVKLYWSYGHWQWEDGRTLVDRFEVLAWHREKTPEPYQTVTEQ